MATFPFFISATQWTSHLLTKICYTNARRNPMYLHRICCHAVYQRCNLSTTSVQMQSTFINKVRKKHRHKVIKKIVLPTKASKEVVEVWRDMTVQQLGEALGANVDHVFKTFNVLEGVYIEKYKDPCAKIDDIQIIKQVASLSYKRCNFIKKVPDKINSKSNLDIQPRPPPTPEVLQSRPPVVTIMGHVDHGKTTLLDKLRQSSIVDQEFGGITQHIGAFSVQLYTGEFITFLDTPGHAAFTSMRARGTQVTDIVVLVVAADDGVMVTTEEAARLAREDSVPMLVAINKIDALGADVEAVKRELLRLDIVVEDLGGDVPCVAISALKGENIEELQEAILMLAEVSEVRGDPGGPCEAAVLESTTMPFEGKVATILVQRGTLQKGTCLVTDTTWARVRRMVDDRGNDVKEVGPGEVAQVTGWRGHLPAAGYTALEVENDARAREVVEWRKSEKMARKQIEDQPAIEEKALEAYEVYQAARSKRLQTGRRYARPSDWGPVSREPRATDHGKPYLGVVIKGDVDGSVEAILGVLDTYCSPHVQLDVIHFGVGDVIDQDVDMARAFEGIVYAFNVDVKARNGSVQVRKHNIIYKLIDDIKEQLQLRMPFTTKEDILGEANVQEQFFISVAKKKVPVAGSRCTKGVLKRAARFKLMREDEVVYDGHVSSLRHFKNEVDSIKFDVECGVALEDVTVTPERGDVIVCYEETEVPMTLDWKLNF